MSTQTDPSGMLESAIEAGNLSSPTSDGTLTAGRGGDISPIDSATAGGSGDAPTQPSVDVSPINIGDPTRIEYSSGDGGQQQTAGGDGREPPAQRFVEDVTGAELPTERQLSQGARDFVGDVVGTTIPNERQLSRQSRQTVSDLLSMDVPSEQELSRQSRNVVSRATDTNVPNERELSRQVRRAVLENPGKTAAAAAPVAIAEPTPLGEIGVAGLLAAGALGGGAVVAADQLGSGTKSEIDVPEDSQRPELETPSGSAESGQSELSIPSETGSSGELDVGETSKSELSIPSEGTTDPTEVRTTQQVVERDDPRDVREITEDDILGDLPAPEQTSPSNRERQRRDELDPYERTFPTGGGAVVGRDAGDATQAEQGRLEDAQRSSVTDSGTDFGSGSATSGVGEDYFAGAGGGQQQGQTPGVDVAPRTDTGTAVDTIAVQQQGQDTVVVPDFATPTETTTGNPTEFPPETVTEPVEVATGSAVSPSRTTKPRRIFRSDPPESPVDGAAAEEERFLERFSYGVASPEDVLSGDIGGGDDLLDTDLGDL